MPGEKGLDTGPAMFAGVDAPDREPTTTRNDSVSETVVGHDSSSGDGVNVHLPEVDMAYAASLKPSKLHGNQLLLMVTFVCGTGVCSVFLGITMVDADPSVVRPFRIRSRSPLFPLDSTCIHRDFPGNGRRIR
jgi:hypothetical protein